MPYSGVMNKITESINRACEAVSSQAALARLLGVKPPTVSQWAHGVRPVPIEHCLPIERATAGAVTRQDLRPDDYWRIWPDLEAPANAQQEAGHA